MNRRLKEATPMICVLFYLLIGFTTGAWALGVIIFLLIPLSSILVAERPFLRIREYFPLIAIIIFLILALGFDLAHPGWLVFLLIPIANSLWPKEDETHHHEEKD